MGQKSSRPRFLFVTNPGSGQGKAKMLPGQIEEILGKEPVEYKITEFRGEDPVASIREVLDEFHPQLAIAAGGDGTVNLVASAILGQDISLAVVPLGSANGLAAELGIPTNAREALKRTTAGETIPIDLLELNGNQMCLHMSDLGMNARVIKRYEREGIRGFLGYAKQYFRELGNRRRFRCRVETDGQTVSKKVVMVAIANASRYGTGAKVTHRGSIDDGRFEVVLVRAFPFWFLFYMGVSMVLRRFNPSHFNHILSCREARIEVSPGQELQVDGEPLGKASSVEVGIRSRALRVIT